MAFLALLLAACGADAAAGPGEGRPNTADELVAQTWQVMQGIQSYRFNGEVNALVVEGEVERPWRRQQDGEWADGAYYVRENGWMEDGTPVQADWASLAGLVLRRVAERDIVWKETTGSQGKPLFVPRFGVLADLKDARWQPDAVVKGKAVYHVTATRLLGVPEGYNAPLATFDLYIRQEDMILMRIKTTVDLAGYFPLDEEGGNGEPEVDLRTEDYYLFDFNEPITVQMPEEWEPIPTHDDGAPAFTPTPTLSER
ncbi:MAG: hypothetical protein C1O27_002443 [Chloroflexi bacterium]|nr:MAG: hypothetical protein C1O27_002443 [Chloroflexota bacterium]